MLVGVAAAICVSTALAVGSPAAPRAAAKDRAVMFQTPAGTRFAAAGSLPREPRPTLFTFAGSCDTALATEPYNITARRLRRRGWLAVTLDLPAHGADARAGEPRELEGWRARFDAGEAFTLEFERRVRDVLDYLIATGRTDPKRVAVCGTSRGGYMAIRAAAADPRFGCVAAFAPVTVPTALREFAGLESSPGAHALDLEQRAAELAGRPMWMCIGDDDRRVGTDHVIALARRVIAASVQASRRPMVELHLMAIEGHGTHPTAYEEAAAWIAHQMEPGR